MRVVQFPLTFISFLLCRDFIFVCRELLVIDVTIVEDKNQSRMLNVEPERMPKDAQLLTLRWVSRHS
jgi:hypothetical protein